MGSNGGVGSVILSYRLVPSPGFIPSATRVYPIADISLLPPGNVGISQIAIEVAESPPPLGALVSQNVVEVATTAPPGSYVRTSQDASETLLSKAPQYTLVSQQATEVLLKGVLPPPSNNRFFVQII
jgi:hypothetical protein